MKSLDLVPTKQVSTNSKQKWINRYNKCLSCKKQRYYKELVFPLKLQSDWDSYKLMKKELQRECRKEYNNYINNLVSEDDSLTSKKLWPFVKKQRCVYCGVVPLEDCGTLHNQP